MAGKHYLNMARELDYGVAPIAGWRGLGVEDLGGHTPVVATLQPVTMVYDQHGPSTRGRRGVERNATGTLKTYLSSVGLALPLEATFGSPVVTVLEPGAYEYVFTTGAEGSDVSLSTQVAREMKGSMTPDHDTFVGGQIGEMRLSQGLPPTGGGVTDEGLAKIEFDINYQRRDGLFSQQLPTYEEAELFYAGGDYTIEIGPDLDTLEEECLNEFTLTYPTGLDFDDRCISTLARDQATRGTLPAPTIQQGWTYKGRKYYEAWLEGTLLALRSRWEPTGDLFIEGTTTKPSITIEIPAFGLTGEAPVESMTESTKQGLPSEVLWNHVDPMITVTLVTSEVPFDEES